MNGIWITAQEIEAMRGLSNLSVRLYIELRRRMDLATQVTGVVRRISRQSLKEECEQWIPRGGGYQRVQPTDKGLRVALQALERQGLIVPDARLPMVFRLVLSTGALARPAHTGPEPGRVEPAAKPHGGEVSAHTGPTDPPQTGPTSSIKLTALTAASTPPAEAPVDHSAAGIAAAFLKRLSCALPYPIRYGANDTHLERWMGSGRSFSEIEQAVMAALAARKRDGSTAPLNPGFINAFLSPVRASADSAPGGGSWGRDPDWASTWPGIEAKAATLGLVRQEGEHYPLFRQRVLRAAAGAGQGRAVEAMAA